VQTVLDSGDPWNFIAAAAATHPIHLIQVVGSTPQPAGCNPNSPPPTGCSDQVVPNDATARIIAAGGFTQAHPPGAAGPALHAFVNFTAGVHASFVDPRVDPAVTQEMQLEAISFTGQPIPAPRLVPRWSSRTRQSSSRGARRSCGRACEADRARVG
jgi:hypothetical protein